MHDIAKVSDVIDNLIETNPDRVAQTKLKPALIGWFVGQTMKRMNGEACQQCVCSALKDRLGL